MPAKTAAGILEANGLKTNSMRSKTIPAIIPDNLVFPPDWILTTVRIVAPAPGRPPKIAPIELPIPCPINSLLGRCLVLVKLSATTDVNKESIAPKRDNVSAVKIYGRISRRLKSVNSVHCIFGNPFGIC